MDEKRKYRKELLCYLTVLKKLLEYILVSSCEKCVKIKNIWKDKNQSFLSAVLTNDTDILYKAKGLIVFDNKKNKNIRNVANKRLLLDTTSTNSNPIVLLNPPVENFDVTLLVALIKNIPENPCFNKKNTCSSGCVECAVKKGVETVRSLRNSVMHDGDNVYEALIKTNQPLSYFPSCKTWGDLASCIDESFKKLLEYGKEKHNFPMSGK